MQKEYEEYNYMYDSEGKPVFAEKKHYLDVMPGFKEMMPHVCITVRIDKIQPDDSEIMQAIFSAASEVYKEILAKRLKKSGRFK